MFSPPPIQIKAMTSRSKFSWSSVGWQLNAAYPFLSRFFGRYPRSFVDYTKACPAERLYHASMLGFTQIKSLKFHEKPKQEKQSNHGRVTLALAVLLRETINLATTDGSEGVI
jgi:hypothetical protein